MGASLSTEEVEKIKAQFRYLDKDNSGILL